GADYLRISYTAPCWLTAVSLGERYFCQPGIGNYLCCYGVIGVAIHCLLSRALFFSHESRHYSACKSFNRNICIHYYAKNIVTGAICCASVVGDWPCGYPHPA